MANGNRRRRSLGSRAAVGGLLLLTLAACDTDTADISGETVGGEDVSAPSDAPGLPDLASAEDGGCGADLIAAGDVVDVAETSPLAFPIVGTGQHACYDEAVSMDCSAAGEAFFGQDAQYETRPPRYVDNGDGTVSDLVTGLTWQQSPGDKMTFDEAVAGASSFSLAGHDDWRLPSIKELYSLIQFSGTDPSGCATEADCPDLRPFLDDTVFDFAYGDTSDGERVIDSQWATSTEYVSTTMDGARTMFGVNFADGRIKGYGTEGSPIDPEGKGFFVLYVRGPAYGENDFEDLGDGTVADHATGLVWTRQDSGALGEGGMLLEDALAFCEQLDLAGHDDWRLPDVKELQSLVDYTRSPDTHGTAAIDPVFSCTEITNEAGQDDFAFYWSSTSHVGTNDSAAGAYVAFGRSLGYMNGAWMDVHGAGSQRSDPKVGDPADYPTGHGPQGDAIRIYNYARCVRGAATFTTDTAPADEGGTVDPIGPSPCEVQADCEVEGACPPEAALGCRCAADPMGQQLCMPACQFDADCPVPPGQTLVCGSDGLCVPQE